ncbi:hypothetical protein C1881_10175 [Slackia isoflavoniconvertens]|uniref:Glycosyl transferase family 1 domain-containing protein n=2 Tax=Slackia isoflavoniconvertens TaxID=572010 RepID=A0A369L9Q5_9ACTN|nr:hypothetical protein C1881_10175 [Slackia isoflavoniconvertens]
MGSTKKIGLIGRLDPECELFDGQTVKTRMMYRLLCELYGEENVVVVETKDYRHNAPRVVAQTVRCLLTCRDVFVSLSRNGRKAFFPLLSFAARHLHTRVYHNLIGGWLAQDLEECPQQVSYLNDFRVNWVESHQLVGKLEELGVGNAEFLPNFKYLDGTEVPESRYYGPGYRFCTFSRVQELKGIGDAMDTVEKLCSEGLDCCLDVYGPIDPSYKEEFETALSRCVHAEYKGCVAPEKSVQAIASYDALLFPTKWKPEGIPGTIIDALAAGVPVIAAKWQYYDEMLEDGVTGFGYGFGNNELLADEIKKFIELGNGANELRKGCLARAVAYSPEAVSDVVAAAVDGERLRD